jgi:uncharacterized protein
VDFDELMKVTYLHEFDRAYQCPTWGYPTEDAYYRDASCVDTLMAVRVPVLAISSTDDPISSYLALPYREAQQNPYTVLCTTSLGGHLGWLESNGDRWLGKPVSDPTKILYAIHRGPIFVYIAADAPCFRSRTSLII